MSLTFVINFYLGGGSEDRTASREHVRSKSNQCRLYIWDGDGNWRGSEAKEALSSMGVWFLFRWMRETGLGWEDGGGGVWRYLL